MDLLSKLAGKRETLTPPAVLASLEQLVVNVAGERRHLETLLQSVNEANLPGVQSALDRAEQQASGLVRRLDDLSTRAEQLSSANRTIEALEARVAALEAAVVSAETKTGDALHRVSEIDRQRSALQDVVTQARESTSRLEALAADPELMQQAAELRRVEDDLQRVTKQQARLASDIEGLQATTTALAESATTAEQLSQRALEAASSAADQSMALERKLETLARIEALAGDTTAQLQSLNGLAEHVSMKLKVLEGQQQTLERALVDSRRVNEMVWEMEGQINKLKEGSTVTARVESHLAELGRLHRDVATALEDAARERSQFTDTLAQHQRQASDLLHDLQGHGDRLAVNRKEMNTLGERLGATQERLADTEGRLAAVSASEQIVGGLAEKIAGLE